ncbi:MAG: hypothetical protein IID35_07090, partial [Planctomycetes bacterium]|nr:hypothetical protein [Planctomycetota bacterium]
MKLPLVFAIQITVSATVSPAIARAIEPIAILAPSDVPEGFSNGFGSSIAISGDYLVVGAKLAPYYNGSREGAAYVFRRYSDQWIEQAKLLPSQPFFFGHFGWDVDIDGDVIVVGAPRWDFVTCGYDRPGSVYLFRRDDQGTPNDPADDTWPEEAILTVADPRISEFFGMSVAVSGDVIVAGGQCGNTVEVFQWSGKKWLHEDSLVAPDTVPGDRLGFSVDVDGTRIVAGAHGDDERRGSAHVFARSKGKWTHEAKLTTLGANPIDDFGQAVSISAYSVLVGSPHSDDAGPSSGSAFVFSRNDDGNWLEQAKLSAPEPAAIQTFGSAVGIDDDLILVRTRGDPWSHLFKHRESDWENEDGLVGIAEVPTGALGLDGN